MRFSRSTPRALPRSVRPLVLEPTCVVRPQKPTIHGRMATFLVVGFALLVCACPAEEPTAPRASGAPAPSSAEVPGSGSGSAELTSGPALQPAAASCEPPEGDLRGDPAVGATSYAEVCVACHGPGAPPMQPPPRDHEDCAYMGSLSDAHLFSVICAGGAAVDRSPTMPPWGGVLSTDQIRGVIAHLRSLCAS